MGNLWLQDAVCLCWGQDPNMPIGLLDLSRPTHRARLAGVTAEGWEGGARLLLCGGGETSQVQSRWTTQDVWARQGGIFHGCYDHTSLPAAWFKSPGQENLKLRVWAEDALFFLLINSLAFG